MTDPDQTFPIMIMTADDHPVVRDGLAAVIAREPGMELACEAANGREALENFRKFRPDVTLMDLQMPSMSGLEAIIAIRSEAPTARIIVLTTYDGDVQALRALKAGASGYLLKTAVRKELLTAIREVNAGRLYIPADIAQQIAVNAIAEPLSEREISVLRLVAKGMANKAIAWELAITEDTVKAHLKSIFAKLDVGDRTLAVMVAVKRGILES